jgi:hypothetical protein
LSLEQTIAAIQAHSWKVVLLGPRSKRPATKTWVVTDDVEQIRNHDGNLGFVAGQSGAIALDFDNLEAMQAMFEELGPLTHWVKTGSGKFHCYYAADSELPARMLWEGTRVGEIQRGPLQQVVMPPSIHPDTGDPYVWLVNPATTRIVPLPEAWKQYLLDSRPGGTTADQVAPPKPNGEDAGELALPIIKVRAGDLPRIIDEAEEALANSPLPIYQRGMDLIRPIRADRGAEADDFVRRPPGALVLAFASPDWIKESMIRSARWHIYSKGADGWVLKDPTKDHVNTLMARKEWRFPVLKTVSPSPTLALDGRIIEREGYDAGTQSLLDFGGVKFPKVPEQPTKKDARDALNRLARPFRKMPFVSSADRSVALSAMLTVMVRASLKAAPLHMFDSPIPGSGKSKIAECVGILKTGGKPPAMSQGANEEEDEKRLSTVLATGDPVILIDNCTKPLNGDFLCSVLTLETVQARILGLSERRLMPTSSFIIATGNNMATGGDTFRRVVLCTLDPKCERPDERRFSFDPPEEVAAQRADLVVDALTVLRAYRVAGSPDQNIKPMGSFEDYLWVRAALVWLGEADPQLSRDRIIANDTASTEMTHILNLWWSLYKDRPVRTSDIKPESTIGIALLEATNKNSWSAKAVGRWLMRHKDRIKDGLSLTVASRSAGSIVWRMKGEQGAVRDAQPEPTQPQASEDDIPF